MVCHCHPATQVATLTIDDICHEIATMTDYTDWDAIHKTPAGMAFEKEMEGRTYSLEAKETAWSWFEAGYQANDDKTISESRLGLLELVKEYCDDLRTGRYVPLPGEDPLLKISDIINIGKDTSLVMSPEAATNE